MASTPAASRQNLTSGGNKSQASKKPSFKSPQPAKAPSKSPQPANQPSKTPQRTPAKLDRPKSAGPVSQAQGARDTAKGATSARNPQIGKAQQAVGTQNHDGDDTSSDETSEDEPMSKVKQAKDELQEQAPEPVADTEDTAQAAADDTGDEADDTSDDATEKAGDNADETDVTDVTDDAQDTTGDATGKAKDSAGRVANGAKDATGKLGKVAKDPSKRKEAADDAADAAHDTVEGATDDVQKVAGDAEDQGEGATDDAKDTAEDATKGAEKAIEDSKDSAEGADGTEDKADKAINGQMPDLSSLPLDKSVLKGLTVDGDGILHGPEGPIGRLIEGDKEDLEGYEVGDDGEILDEDGDLVGRCELLPAEIKKQMAKAKEKDELPEGADDILEKLPDDAHGVEDTVQLPGLDILNGLTCNIAGEIYNDDGDKIGEVTEGNPEELMKAKLNEHGEFINAQGDVVGKARVHEEAAEIYLRQSQDAAGAVEDQLPGVEALKGRELNETGEILDDKGNVLGQVDEPALKEKLENGEINAEDLKINEEGQVVDSNGNVIGNVGLAEGAAEKLKEAASLDIRILESKKLGKKGKILDEDGEIIGELAEGELSECTGKKVNDKGEILDKSGKVIGKVTLVLGEAAEAATKQLLEELGETAEDQGPQMKSPDLDILEGLKVNKKGQILDEDGEVIGELTDGELSKCTGKKANAKGEVLDTDGNVIGHVKTIPHEVTPQEAEATAQEGEGKAEEDEEVHEGKEAAEGEGAADDELPPLSVLEGLTVNKAGKIVNGDGTIIGELIEGDAKKLFKLGAACDGEGQFWDSKGHVIGRAKTLAVEDPDQEAEFAGLEGLVVAKDGWVVDANDNHIGRVIDGDFKKLVGRAVDEDGDILDKKGNVVGHAERHTEPDEAEPDALDLSSLEGRILNKAGFIMGDDGTPIGRLVEGKAKSLAGRKCDTEGQIWSDGGKVIGRCELIPEDERETKVEGPFAGYQGLHVTADGKVADADDNVVGQIVEGRPKRLVGMTVDEDGDILDKYGNVKGHAEPSPEEEEVDYTILDGKKLNKKGFVVDDSQNPIGKLVEGDAKELAGRRCDAQGHIYNDTGKVVGKCEPLPPDKRSTKPEGPFGGLEGLHVIKDGWIQDENENVVGKVIEGNFKRLVGMSVDEDGDIVDKNGNVKGHADPYEEEDENPEDLSALKGCTVNKAGNVVDAIGTVIGRVAEGDVKAMIGKKVDGKGQIWDNSGQVVGRAELVHGQDTSPEGPFAGFDSITVSKDGTVVTAGGDVVGRIVEGDVKKLVGHQVDTEGDITDKNGNCIGKADRWEPEEKERKVNPMSGRKVNKDGEIRNEEGNVIGRLTMGDLGRCIGNEIDDNGNVVDSDGEKIGEATRIENIAEEEEEEEEEEAEEEEMTEEELQKQQDREIAGKMTSICKQTLERIQPICKQIKEHMEAADRKPKGELDEEKLVNDVKPLIEEGGRMLQECSGSLRGLDPDGSIAAKAKSRSETGEASPEEHRLAECLKELTSEVTTTIDDARKKLKNMPAARKKLNPLFALLSQPLFQILSAVGLLLTGVLGLLGQILTLGEFNLTKSILGGLGVGKLFGDIGKKGKEAVSNIPIIGRILGGK